MHRTIHYPYGMLMPGRHFSDNDGYRYGFNGMEADDEVKGEGNHLDFGARCYDPRIGRWFSRDPLEKKYPGYSPYAFVQNSPLLFMDVDGKDSEPTKVHHAIKGALTLPSNAEVYKVASNATYEAHDTEGNKYIFTNSSKAEVVAGFYLPTAKGHKKWYASTFSDGKFVGYYADQEMTDGVGVDGVNTMETIPFNSLSNSDNILFKELAEKSGDNAPPNGIEGSINENKATVALSKEALFSVAMLTAGIIYVANYSDLSDMVSLDVNFQWPEELPNVEIKPIDVVPQDLTIKQDMSKVARGKHKSDEFEGWEDSEIDDAYNQLKGKLDKAQKQLKQKLKKEQKARGGRNKQKNAGEKNVGSGN